MKLKPVTSWSDVPLVMDLTMAARIVGQSAEYLKKRAQRGTFPAYREGSQWRVSKSALIQHIDGATAAKTKTIQTVGR